MTKTVRYSSCLHQPHWRVPITGFLWRTFDFFHRKGHVRITPEGLRHIRSFTPSLHAPFDVTAVAICMIHTMAPQSGLRGILEGWYLREGHLPAVSSPLPVLPAPPNWAPWQTIRPWSNDTWSLSVLLLNRFLNQPFGCREDAFLESLYDIYATLGPEVAMIEFMVAIMFFVRSASWVWSCLFNPIF